MDEPIQKRYKNSLDTFSLQDHDAIALSAEEVAQGDLGFVDILCQLTTDRQRFIALALYQGWNKVEIARMLHVDPSGISHTTRLMKMKLAMYRVRYRSK